MGYGNGVADWGGPGVVADMSDSWEIRNLNKEIVNLHKVVQSRVNERNRALIGQQAWLNVARILEEKNIYSRDQIIALHEIAQNACVVDFNKKGAQEFMKYPIKESPLETLKKMK